MKSLTRRAFLEGTALCAARAALGQPAGGPHAHFPTEGARAAGSRDLSFSRVDPGCRQPGSRCVQTRHGSRCVWDVTSAPSSRWVGSNPLNSHFASTEFAEVRKLRTALDAVDVRTVNIPVDEPVELCSDDEAKRRAGNASYRRWIDIAVILGGAKHPHLAPEVYRRSRGPHGLARVKANA